MSQVESEPRWSGPCRDCGAENDPAASECWLCHRRDWRGPSRLPSSPKPAPSRMDDDLFPKIALAALGMVVLGGLAIAPGLVIGLLIVVLPPFVGAEIIAKRRQNRGLPTSTTRKVAWIVALAVLLPILLSVALTIALWLICLVNGSPTNFH
jgi:hypothetical protein